MLNIGVRLRLSKLCVLYSPVNSGRDYETVNRIQSIVAFLEEAEATLLLAAALALLLAAALALALAAALALLALRLALRLAGRLAVLALRLAGDRLGHFILNTAIFLRSVPIGQKLMNATFRPGVVR